METQAVLPVVETSTSTNETAAASTLKDSAFFNEETQALLPNGVTPSTSIPKQKLFHEETLALGDQTRSELPTQIEQEIETDEEGENTTLNSVDQTAGTELNKNEEESKSTQPFMVDGAKVTPEGKESADVISTPIVATRTTKSLLSLVEEAPLAKEDDPPTAPTKENAAANETAEGASDVKDKCAMDDDEDDLFLMATQDIVLDVDQEKGLSKETEPADEKKNPPLDSSASGKDNHDVSFESDVSENLLADDLEDGVSTSIVKSGENNSEVAKISPSPVKTQKAKENEADQSIDSEVSTQLESFEEVNGDEKDAQVENQGRSEEDLNGDSNKQSLKLGDASEGLDTTKELSEEQSAEAVSGTGTKAEDLYDAETQNLDDFESDDEIIPNSQDSDVDRTNFVDLPMEMTKSFRTASIKTNVPVVGPESGNQEAEKSYGSDQAIEEKEVEHTLADGRKDGKEESCQNERSEPDCVEGNVETITCDNKEKVNEAETIPLPNSEEESVERKDQPNEQESETIILEELPDISIGEQVNPEEDHVLDEPHDVSGSLDREDMEVEGSPKPMNEDEPSSCSLELPSTQNLLNSVSDASSRPRKYEMESPEEDKLTDSGEDHLIIDESKSRVKKKNTESQAKLPGGSKESDKSSTDPDFSSGQGSKELKNTRKKSAILPCKDKLVTEENIRKSGRQTKRSSRFANEDFVSGKQAIKRTPADPSPKKKATAPRGNKRMRKEEANNKTESIDGAKALKNEGAEEKQKNIGSSEKTTKPCVEDQSNVNGKEEHVMSNNAGNIDACQVLEEPSPAEAVKLARRSSSKKLDANDFAKELSQIHAKNPRVEECEETSVKTCVAVQPITLKNGIEQSGEEITEIKDVSTEKGTSSSKRGRRSKKPDNNKDFKEEPNSSSQTESNNMEIGNNVQDSKRSRKPRASVNVTPPPRSRGRKGRQSLKDDGQQPKIETALQPTRNSRRPKKKETEVNNTTDGQNIEDEPEEMKRRAGDKKQESHDESLDDIPKTVSGLALVGRSRRLVKKKKVECNVVAEGRPESEGRKEANVSNAGNAANDEPAISPVVEPELSNAVEDHKPAEQPLEPIVSESSDKQTRGRRGSRFPTKSPSISPAKSPSRNRAASSPAAPKQVATMTTKTPVASPTKSPAKKGKVAASTTTPVKNLPVQRSSRLSASKLSPKLKEDKPTTDSKHPSPPEISEPATKRARLSGKVVPEASRKLSRSSARNISPCTTPIKKEPESPAKRGRTSKALSEPNVPASQTSQTKNECEVENTSVTEKVSEGRQSRRQKANKSLPDSSVETSTNKRKVLKEDDVSAKDSPPSAKKLKPETPIKRGRGRKTAAEPFPQDIKATEVKIEDVPAQEKATDGRRSARQKSSQISTAAVAEATGAKKRQIKVSDNPEPKESPAKKTKPETPVKRGRGSKAAAKSTPQESETIDLNIECKSTTAPQNTAQSRRSGRPNARKMQESEDPPTPKKRKSSTIAPKKTVKVERRVSSTHLFFVDHWK